MGIDLIIETYITNNYSNDRESEHLLDRNKLDNIPWSEWFDTWLNALVENLPQASGYELSLLLTSDREIATFNDRYRQKDTPTDVLAFAALESNIMMPLELAESLYLGDIVISLDTAYQQANEQQHSLTVELAWLASHGLLHLLGWDHPDNDTLNEMLEKQANLLKLVEITE